MPIRTNMEKMIKRVLLTLIIGFSASSSYAQQDLFNQSSIRSPEIHDDNSVTFRLHAPYAEEVLVTGSLDGENAFATISYEMVKDEVGIWSFTTPVLPPEFYRYHFLADSVRTIDPSNAHSIRDVANISSVFLVDGGKADMYQVNDVPHGTVSYRWYESPGNEKLRRMAVYTPYGYENSKSEYPVLYLLHGAGGDEEAWLGSGRAAQIMDNLIAQGRAKPMIVIMPNGNVSQDAAPGEGNAGFVNPTFMMPNTMDGTFEATFDDVMRFVEKNYRTTETKGGRAIAGLSMGGFHTAYISMNYPDTFDYMGLFSSALGVRPRDGESLPMHQNVNEKLREQKQNGYELYWMGIGVDDMQVLYQGNVDFRNRLDSLGMEYEYHETDGGHTWNNWRDYLVIFAQRLFQD